MTEMDFSQGQSPEVTDLELARLIEETFGIRLPKQKATKVINGVTYKVVSDGSKGRDIEAGRIRSRSLVKRGNRR